MVNILAQTSYNDMSIGGAIVLGGIGLLFTVWKYMLKDIFQKKMKPVATATVTTQMVKIPLGQWQSMKAKLATLSGKMNQYQTQVQGLKQMIEKQAAAHAGYRLNVSRLLKRIDKNLQKNQIQQARVAISTFIDVTQDISGSGMYKAQ